MKKILITGAAGMIGMQLIKELINEEKIEITAVDLKNLKSQNNFKKYENKINVLYGDLTNRNFVESIVEKQDYIVHLATVQSPEVINNKELSELMELKITENFTRALTYFNTDCHFVYGSTTSVYGDKEKEVTVDTKVKNTFKTFYDKNKYKSENLITKKIKNYTIVRMPLVLGKIDEDKILYNFKKDSIISTITKEDAALFFAEFLKNEKKVKDNIINISGDESFTLTYEDLISSFIKNNALSIKMIMSLIFLEKNNFSPVVSDTKEINKKLGYQKDTMSNYLSRVKYNCKGKHIAKITKGVFLRIWEKKK
ncbi:MAG: NAD(P)-dependent oxidoreductase [bacterium]